MIVTRGFCVSLGPSVSVRVNIIQSDNGQTLSPPDRPKPRRHNAKRCPLDERHAIVLALANHDSVESIRRTYHKSRHTVLAIRQQYAQEIEEAQKLIRMVVETKYLDAQSKAIALMEQKMAACSPIQLMKICDWLTDKALKLETSVQASPYPLSIKLAALRRAKRNGLPLPSP